MKAGSSRSSAADACDTKADAEADLRCSDDRQIARQSADLQLPLAVPAAWLKESCERRNEDYLLSRIGQAGATLSTVSLACLLTQLHQHRLKLGVRFSPELFGLVDRLTNEFLQKSNRLDRLFDPAFFAALLKAFFACRDQLASSS